MFPREQAGWDHIVAGDGKITSRPHYAVKETIDEGMLHCNLGTRLIYICISFCTWKHSGDDARS
jgi:hypothetical protein